MKVLLDRNTFKQNFLSLCNSNSLYNEVKLFDSVHVDGDIFFSLFS